MRKDNENDGYTATVLASLPNKEQYPSAIFSMATLQKYATTSCDKGAPFKQTRIRTSQRKRYIRVSCDWLQISSMVDRYAYLPPKQMNSLKMIFLYCYNNTVPSHSTRSCKPIYNRITTSSQIRPRFRIRLAS